MKLSKKQLEQANIYLEETYLNFINQYPGKWIYWTTIYLYFKNKLLRIYQEDYK